MTQQRPDMTQRWAQERERHDRQVQPYRYFAGRSLRSTATTVPARLRFWSYVPPRPWFLVVGTFVVAGLLGWQVAFSRADERADVIRFVAVAVLVLVLATTRITVSNHGLSFDVAGLRRVSSFGFVPLFAVTDVALDPPEDWPAARNSSGWLPGSRPVYVRHLRPDGELAVRRVWVRDAAGFGAAVLGRPVSRD